MSPAPQHPDRSRPTPLAPAGVRGLARDVHRALGREPLVPLAILTLVAAAIRVLFLDMPMRLDEATTFNEFVLQPWRATLGKYWATNNHPLHSVFAKLVVDMLGREPWVVRIPAFVSGVLVVPATFLVVARMFSRRAAWFAAIAVTILPVFILFSANARGYSLVVLFMLLQWLALRDALIHGRRASWVLVALLGALGVYTHLTMAYAYAGNAAWALLWSARQRDGARRRVVALVASGVASVAIAVVLYLPFVYISGIRALVANENVSATSFASFTRAFPILLSRIGASWGMGLPPWMAAACGIVAAIALLDGARARTAERALPMVSTLVVLALLLATLRVPPPRAVLYLLPGILGAVGGLIDRIASRLPRAQAVGVWAFAAVPLLTIGVSHVTRQPVRMRQETGWMPEARPIFDRLQESIQPGDAIASTFLPRDILRYYYLRAGKGRAPLVPEVCPKPPHRLYLIVSSVESPVDVLTYAWLPRALAASARLLDQRGSYSIWVADVPEGVACPTRIGRWPRDQ